MLVPLTGTYNDENGHALIRKGLTLIVSSHFQFLTFSFSVADRGGGGRNRRGALKLDELFLKAKLLSE